MSDHSDREDYSGEEDEHGDPNLEADEEEDEEALDGASEGEHEHTEASSKQADGNGDADAEAEAEADPDEDGPEDEDEDDRPASKRHKSSKSSKSSNSSKGSKKAAKSSKAGKAGSQKPSKSHKGSGGSSKRSHKGDNEKSGQKRKRSGGEGGKSKKSKKGEAKRPPTVSVISTKRKGPIATLARTYPHGAATPLPYAFTVPSQPGISASNEDSVEVLFDQQLALAEWDYVDSYIQAYKLLNHVLLGLTAPERNDVLFELGKDLGLTHTFDDSFANVIAALLKVIRAMDPPQLKKSLSNRGKLLQYFNTAHIGQSKRERAARLTALLGTFDEAVEKSLLERVLEARCLQHPTIMKALLDTGSIELREDKKNAGVAVGPIYMAIRAKHLASQPPQSPEDNVESDGGLEPVHYGPKDAPIEQEEKSQMQPSGEIVI